MGKGDGENRKGDGRREKREEIARERKEGTSERGGENMNKQEGRKDDALNTFYLRLYGVRHMVKDHSDSERGNSLLPLYELLLPISSKGSFICTTPQTV